MENASTEKQLSGSYCRVIDTSGLEKAANFAKELEEAAERDKKVSRNAKTSPQRTLWKLESP
jgi:hypothetical protein